MRVVPFCRIQLVLSRQPSPSLPNESLGNFYRPILQQLPCRHFSEHFVEEWEKYRDTPALEFVRTILNGFCNVLQQLSFIFSRQHVEMPQQLVQDKRFLRLKILRMHLGDRATADESFGHCFKSLVSRAPSFEELQIRGRIFHENILEGSSAVLVPCLAFSPLYDRICESLIGALRPNFIHMQVRETGSFDEELLNRQIPRVLQASLPTLHKVHMDLLVLVPLMCYGICLENVTVLVIRVDSQCHLQPRVSTLLKRFDFTRIFPKLSQVEIAHWFMSSVTPEQFSRFVEQRNAALKDPLPDRAVNIKQMSLVTVPCSGFDSRIIGPKELFQELEASHTYLSRGPA